MIAIENVCKNYTIGDEVVHALKNVQLNINKGEFISIIGASGSGKSTLMNILGCLDVPDSGKYFLDGENVMSMNDNRLAEIRNRKIGFVFQSSNLLPKLSAIENVELPLIYRNMNRKERHERAIRSMEMVGLNDRMYHKPNELSGGQQQRTAIARAIAGEPEIILADEPTGNLDSKSGIEIMNILVNLNNKRKTIVLITHDLSIAHYAHRIVTIRDGELNEENQELS